LGLYVLGRRAVFEPVHELQPALARLLDRPDQLELVTGEMFPATRRLLDGSGGDGGGGGDGDGDDQKVVESTPMVSVEHLGQYVYEMTKAKVAQLKGGLAALLEEGVEVVVKEEEESANGEEDDGAELVE
jgi:intron-binding protein aquarius